MKKIITILLIAFTLSSAQAQKVIENPNHSASTASTVFIKKITLYDTATAFDFEVHHIPYWDIWLNSDELYIQNSKGGEKLYITGTKDIQLDSRDKTPKSGINSFTLYFPPIDHATEMIDFVEAEWRFYDIELVPQKHISLVPEELKGNWLKTDGTNQWVLGIYENLVIYEEELWPTLSIRQEKKKYWLFLKNEKHEKQLKVTRKKGNLILQDGQNSQLLTRDLPGNDVFSFQDPEWELTYDQPDTAHWTGYIDGYHPRMGFSTGKVYVYDVFGSESDFTLLEIADNGTFIAKVPLQTAQVVSAAVGNKGFQVFLQPGEKLLQYVDLDQHTRRDLKDGQLEKLDKNTLFMGNTARVNHDLLATAHIGSLNNNKINKRILEMDLTQFRDSMVHIASFNLTKLADFTKNYPLSTIGRTIKTKQLKMDPYNKVFMFNYHKENAYRQKHGLMNRNEHRIIPLEEEFPDDTDFFTFVHDIPLNDSENLMTGLKFYSLVKRIMYADVKDKQKRLSVSFADILKNVKFDSALTADEMLLVEKAKTISEEDVLKKLFQSDSVTWKSFFAKNREAINATATQLMKTKRDKQRDEMYSTYFNIDDGFFKDITKVQDVFSRMESTLEPLSETEMAELKNEITDPAIYAYAVDRNNAQIKENEQKLSAFNKTEGAISNEIPAVDDNKVFEAIMEKYRGKIVYVDFWATWCGPCRSGIKRIKPLKDKMKDKDVVFVYITNHTSPEKTYQLMMPEIIGEHYKVSEDQWNHFAARFNITGIPHYVLVDKHGKVVKNNFRLRNHQLEAVFNEYL